MGYGNQLANVAVLEMKLCLIAWVSAILRALDLAKMTLK